MDLLTLPTSARRFSPSSRSTSAEPHCEVEAMFPCFATTTPAPAAMKAAVVETLKVPAPSPPVPTMSTGSRSPTSIFTPASPMALAAPASSAAVTWFLASAVRNEASSISPTSPERIAAKKPSHSPSDRLSPSSARRSAALRTDGGAALRMCRPVASSTKFASCRMPSGVPIDSGWYCTDSIGRVLWRRPIISPSSLSAETSKQSGSVARSTASEW